MSLATSIADSVCTALSAGSFSVSFTPVRAAVPKSELENVSGLNVTVVPRSVAIKPVSRAVSRYDVAVDIGVQKRVSDMKAETASLGNLVDEIGMYLRKTSLMAFPQAHWISTENDPVYMGLHLLEKRVFTSILTITYSIAIDE